jgi:vacuole morphology and inheritance protein 14
LFFDFYLHKVARETNEELRSIHVEPSDGFDVGAILSVARRQLSSEFEATRIEALNWISTLLNKHRTEVKKLVFAWASFFSS